MGKSFNLGIDHSFLKTPVSAVRQTARRNEITLTRVAARPPL
jgi:hypothetical protein